LVAQQLTLVPIGSSIYDVNSKAFQVDFPGAIATLAEVIDNAGDIVGEYADSSLVGHPFLATPTLPGQMGTELTSITGSLTPLQTPEPNTMLLVCAALVAVVIVQWHPRRIRPSTRSGALDGDF